VGAVAKFTTPPGRYSKTPVFNWLAVGDAARYEIQINRVDQVQYKVVHETNLTGTSFTVAKPLVSGGRYRIWIRAISNTGELSQWSNALEFTVVAAAKESNREVQSTLSNSANLDVLDGIVLTQLQQNATRRFVEVGQAVLQMPVSPKPFVSAGAGEVSHEFHDRPCDVAFPKAEFGDLDAVIQSHRLLAWYGDSAAKSPAPPCPETSTEDCETPVTDLINQDLSIKTVIT
jgi:hypothetical protein